MGSTKTSISYEELGLSQKMLNRKSLAVLPVLAAMLAMEPIPSVRGEEVLVHSREALQAAVRDAKPGMVIKIAPGKYRGGLGFSNVWGTKDKPIVLAGADSENPPVFEGGGSAFHFRAPRDLELRDLVLSGATGNGLNIDDGGNDSPAERVVLSNLQITDVGPRGNRDGLKLSGVDQFLVENCTFERWGSGGSAIDMVGCHQGEIQSCTFRYRSDLGANGVQTKGGSSEIAIKRCRFENAGSRAVNIGGSTGLRFFRPSGARYEAKDITVEDCTFIGSMAPIAFVGVDGAIVRHNTIYRPARWIVRILQENRSRGFVPSRNGRFTNNLVVFRSDEIRTVVNISDATAPETFQFSNNHWYCQDQPERSRRLSLPVPETGGTYGVDPQFVDEKGQNLRLSKTSPVRDAGVREQADPE